MTSKFQPSSKSNPCPVCGRTRDGDCRTLEAGNVVLCHTLQDGGDGATGYKFIRTSTDGAGWGVWVWAEKKGKKYERTAEDRFTYLYNDRNGNRLIRVQRQKDKTPPFWQEYWYGNTWVTASKLPDAIKADYRKRIPIYRYREVREAIEKGEEVVWVEGEKAADSLWSIGVAATTSIGGSKAYRHWGDYKHDLDGARVVIICPDRDEVGVKYANEVAKDFPDAKWMRVYPNSPVWNKLPDDGGLDIADWLEHEKPTPLDMFKAVFDELMPPKKEAVLEVDEILDYVDFVRRSTREGWRVEAEIKGYIAIHKLSQRGLTFDFLIKAADDRSAAQETFEVEDARDLMKSSSKLNYLINGIVPRGTVIALAASGGVGKTTLLYQFAKHVALGQPWSECGVRPGRTLIIQTDEPRNDIVRKLRMNGFNDIPHGSVVFKQQWRFNQFKALEAHIRKERYDLVIIDSWTACNAGGGVDLTKSSAGDNIYLLRDLAQEVDCTFIVIHHLNKAGDFRDSSTLKDNVSEVWKLYKPDRPPEGVNEDEFILEIPKSRSGIDGEYILKQDRAKYGWMLNGAIEFGKVSHAPLLGRVLTFLEADPGTELSALKVADHFGGSSKIKEILETLVAQGSIKARNHAYTRDGEEKTIRLYWAEKERGRVIRTVGNVVEMEF